MVSNFKNAREKLMKTVNKFPKHRREEKLFDDWSLKDILIHLTGWAAHQTETLKTFKQGRTKTAPSNLKASINEVLVSNHQTTGFETVHLNFVSQTDELITEYESLPKSSWNKKIWADKDTTPKDYIQIEINHYKNTHGPKIEQALKDS